MNTITQVLPWFQLVLSLLLVILVLLQRSADGIEGALGGSASNMTYFARRGAERFLFFGTIVIAILFAISAVLPLVIR
ncbi:preprotein translocase subunit SecG [bacterium]|nr:preprotein translocase subunit SecG [bacterium]